LNEDYLVEDEIEYPVSFNGKMKFKISLSAHFLLKKLKNCMNEKLRILEVKP
jgi:leucyl-tRNA synthetase